LKATVPVKLPIIHFIKKFFFFLANLIIFEWFFNNIFLFNTQLPLILHKYYKIKKQCKIIVKVHRVLPSSYNIFASSQRFQFHWNISWDSRTVVTSLMQVGTYPTWNFSTLGPSELQPPFTEIYIISQHQLLSQSSTGQMSDPIHHFTILQSLVFLLNSRYSFFFSIHDFYLILNILFPEVTQSICRVP